jgi:hypothetical protein
MTERNKQDMRRKNHHAFTSGFRRSVFRPVFRNDPSLLREDLQTGIRASNMQRSFFDLPKLPS